MLTVFGVFLVATVWATKEMHAVNGLKIIQERQHNYYTVQIIIQLCYIYVKPLEEKY